MWGSQGGGDDGDFPADVVVDPAGDVFVTGRTFSSMYSTYSGSGDYFLAKFSGATGAFIWGAQEGTGVPDYGQRVEIEYPDSGSYTVAVTGLGMPTYSDQGLYFSATFDSSSGERLTGINNAFDPGIGVKSVTLHNVAYNTDSTDDALYAPNEGESDYWITKACSDNELYGHNKTHCIDCPAGSDSPNSDQTACTCSAGYSNSGGGGTMSDPCDLCEEGYYSEPGAEVCTGYIPTGVPTMRPSDEPSAQPSQEPTSPSVVPSGTPTSSPTSPTGDPTQMPTSPSSQPSGVPSTVPSSCPTFAPSGQPSSIPTCPSTYPTSQPTSVPTSPSGYPTGEPSKLPTSCPSGVPTGYPTGCKPHSHLDNSGQYCVCDAGYSGRDGKALVEDGCDACPAGEYSNEAASSCSTCAGITWSLVKASSECNYFRIDHLAIEYVFIFFVLSLTISFALSMLTKPKFPEGYEFVACVLFSTFDFQSDVFYLFDAVFVEEWFIYLSAVFLLLPSGYFLYRIIRTLQQSENELYGLRQFFPLPRKMLLWIPSVRERYPYIGDMRTLPRFILHLSNPLYFFLYVLSWPMWFLYISIFVVVNSLKFLPWIAVHIPYYILLFVVGYVLSQCQLYQHSAITVHFLEVLLCQPEFQVQTTRLVDGIDLDASNIVLMFQLGLETIPQFLLQVYNNWRILGSGNGELTWVVIVSTLGSVMIIISCLYKFGYWYIWIGLDRHDIPLFSKPHPEAIQRAIERRGGGSGAKHETSTLSLNLETREYQSEIVMSPLGTSRSPCDLEKKLRAEQLAREKLEKEVVDLLRDKRDLQALADEQHALLCRVVDARDAGADHIVELILLSHVYEEAVSKGKHHDGGACGREIAVVEDHDNEGGGKGDSQAGNKERPSFEEQVEDVL